MDQDNYLTFLGSPVFWLVGAPLVLCVIVQSVLYIRLCFKQAKEVDFPKSKLYQAIKSGAITSVGPAFTSFLFTISIMTIFGGPITWHRLLIIGAPPTEIVTATIGANAMGQTLGPGMDFDAVFLALIIMALNGCGWLIVCTIITPRLDKFRLKMSGGDMAWLGILSAAASVGLTGNFASQQLLVGPAHMAGVITGFTVQFVFDKFVVPRREGLRAYVLSISLTLGITAAALVGAYMEQGA